MTPRIQNSILVATACVVALGLFEAAGRLLVRSDDRSSGTLMGVRLPPIKIFASERHLETPRDVPYRNIVVDGNQITLGDLSGYYRYDELLGYAVLEDTFSVNRWWESNNLGARESVSTNANSTAGTKRLLLLGDSFAHGSGVPGTSTWAAILERASPDVEIINLGVDGYGMGQAYLRYRSLSQKVDHHGVVLMFVPTANLWRDVNTIRDLGEFWNVQIVMPRYIIEDDQLKLVRSPYRHPTDVYVDNGSGLSPTLREHLRRHDRFYFAPMYESYPVVGDLITFKTMAAGYGALASRLQWRGLMKPDSEAMRVSHEIFLALQGDLEQESREFHLLILPTPWDLEKLRNRSGYAQSWKEMVNYACRAIEHCTDLSPALSSLPQAEIDIGYDGIHFGPKANKTIADAAKRAIIDLK